MRVVAKHSVKVADEVWIATALLHRENPDRSDFTVGEIVERARKEGIAGELRPGVYVHALLRTADQFSLSCISSRADITAKLPSVEPRN